MMLLTFSRIETESINTEAEKVISVFCKPRSGVCHVSAQTEMRHGEVEMKLEMEKSYSARLSSSQVHTCVALS